MAKTVNQDIAQIEKSLDGLGIGTANADVINKADPGVMTLDNTTFGGILPREFVDAILDDVHDQSTWLKEINEVRRQGKKGTVPVLTLEGNISEGVGENEKLINLTRPATTNVPYLCKSYGAIWSITLNDLAEARAAGMTQFEETVRGAFAKALANDRANIVLNSDDSLDDSTSLNRMLRMIDGFAVKSESGNVIDAEGIALSIETPDHFSAMEDAMPGVYANDENLKWLFHRRVGTHYRSLLKPRETALGDKYLESRDPNRPNGIPSVIVPQISVQQGPTAIAPTSAADGTTYIEFVLTTLVTAEHVASAALGVGRRFKVTHVASGNSEICTGFLDTTLRINTAGLLGQTTVSTTNTDYVVGLADETDLYLCNPKGITVVDCYEMETYRLFRPEFRRWEFYTYYHLDVLIPIVNALVKLKRVAVTPKSAIA